MNLDIDLLRTFVAVVETGSFTRSAALMGRTQPAISLQIRRLEEQMGAPLLDRSGRSVTLTTEGASLLPQARKLLRLNDEIVSTMGEGDLEGEVRFGAPEDIATMHLPGILGAFARAHPRIKLAVTCDYTSNLLDQMSRGMLDLALIKREPMGPDLGVRVWREPLVWVALDASILELSPLPLIVAPAPDIYRKRALGTLDAAGLSYRASFTSPSLSGQMAALRAGLGVGVLPAAMAPRDLSVLHAGLPPLSDSEIALVSSRSGGGPAELLAQEVLRALERGPTGG
ncbi:LysR substrate-binding domain-containing protein [Brevundimonas subvibrioides]|uniref:Transcriptional regulator, LysR family n=1 Tax=Brevundimonas subvibrioides (strain ATCC 15264 / DSM 4735 / LMG 14903 / NBRC 16000 / CB 81) TaxID=633149 RepID=D9QLR1_BRESC|nr:LysR substrate-binding domain-containing protein [Brevundimonas subvibrioides]ADK99994.1 transcriptional regulator, LysR family [Brevundimonas subvibrioides ATCC 15264]